MQNEILYGIIGLLVGILIGIFSASQAVNNNMTGMMQMMGDKTDMTRLEQSEDFDRAFIEEMKQLADNIITAQTDEIEQMRSWYSEWYK